MIRASGGMPPCTRFGFQPPSDLPPAAHAPPSVLHAAYAGFGHTKRPCFAGKICRCASRRQGPASLPLRAVPRMGGGFDFVAECGWVAGPGAYWSQPSVRIGPRHRNADKCAACDPARNTFARRRVVTLGEGAPALCPTFVAMSYDGLIRAHSGRRPAVRQNTAPYPAPGRPASDRHCGGDPT